MGSYCNDWFYMGLVDDRVKAFPLSGLRSTDNPIDQIVQTVLLGGRPVIHQSAMLIQAPFVEDLLKGEASLIRALSEAHHLRVLSSEGDFLGWVRQSIDNGVYASDWHLQNGTTVRTVEYLREHSSRIDSAARHLLDRELFIAFPETNPSSVLFESVRQLQDWDPGDDVDRVLWDAFFAEFLRTFREDLQQIDSSGNSGTKYPPTRTHWEAAVRKVFARNERNQRYMMAIINEHYHATFASLLSHELGEPNAIGVATIATGNYRGYMPSSDPIPSEEVEVDKLPRIRYKLEAVRDNLHKFTGNLFGSGRLGKSRATFIELAAGPLDSVRTRESLKHAAEVYEEELARTFGYLDDLNGKKIDPNNRWVTVGFAVTVGAIAALTETTKGSLGPAFQFGHLVPIVIATASAGAVLSKLADPAIRSLTSLVTDLRLHDYDKLRPVITLGAQPILTRANNRMYIERLLASPEIRSHKHLGKLKLSQHQLRKG